MDARKTKRIRRRLLEELGQRGRLLGKMQQSVLERSAESASNGRLVADHIAENPTEQIERESDYLLCDAQGRDVQEIEEAIRRIDEGIYGSCEACGSEIENRRLEVLPSARYCLRCQERQERQSIN
jgi:RNA polymerase-binding transcription factor DksA